MDPHPPVDTDQPVVSRHEIALMLGGVSKTRVWQITDHPTFPARYASVRSCDLWRTSEVRAWIRRRPAIMEERLRLRGAPPKRAA